MFIFYFIVYLGLMPCLCNCANQNDNKLGRSKPTDQIIGNSVGANEAHEFYEGANILSRPKPTTELREEADSGCVVMDGICISSSDVSSYEAIKALHSHLDDDQSGDIDLTESVDFLREELNYTKGLEKRQKAFHHNNDQHISVQELWEIWLANEVHNWTVEQTVGWLHVGVELGQYADIFYENAINGSILPRLATNNEQFLTRILGIKNPTHRSKISIKAMDIVLFGPPKGSLIKDIFIASLIFVIVVLLIKFNNLSRRNNQALRKMDQEMEALQEELLRFHEEKKIHEDGPKVQSIKGEPKSRDEEESGERTPSRDNHWEDEMSYYDGSTDFREYDTVTVSEELDYRSKNELQLWLQLTYEKEKINLENKILTMKVQMEEARDMCDKMKPNRKNLFGALSFVHGKLESKGQPILQAKAAFAEIQAIDKEMLFRWNAMERLLGFPISQNGGIDRLQLLLEPTLQTTLSHSASTAVGLANAVLEGRAESSSSNSICRTGVAPEDAARKRRISQFRGSSVVSEGSMESGTVSPIMSVGSTRSQRSLPLQTLLSHSHTVGSGLSDCGAEDFRPRSSSSESRARITSSGNQSVENVSKTVSNGYSTDDTDSSIFTVGESSVIKINPHGSNASGHRIPSDHLLRSTKENSPRTLSDKNKIGKYSSEPSLESEEKLGREEQDHDQISLKPMKKGLLRNSKFFSKFKTKTDKNKHNETDGKKK